MSDRTTALTRPPDASGHPSGRGLDVKLAEYSAIRAEVLQALQGQQSVLNFGASTLSVLLVAAGVVDEGVAKVAILSGIVPIAAVLVMTLWSCELVRMRRAGAYLLALEAEINSAPDVGGSLPMQWEHRVNPPGRGSERLPSIDRLQQCVVGAVVALLAIVSSALGTVYSTLHLDAPLSLDLWAPVAAAVGAGFGALVVMIYFVKALQALEPKHGTRDHRFGPLPVQLPQQR